MHIVALLCGPLAIPAWHKRMRMSSAAARPRRIAISDSSRCTLTRVCRQHAAGAQKPSHTTAERQFLVWIASTFPSSSDTVLRLVAHLHLTWCSLAQGQNKLGFIPSPLTLIWVAIGQNNFCPDQWTLTGRLNFLVTARSTKSNGKPMQQSSFGRIGKRRTHSWTFVPGNK